jgi:hypothetical protein
MRRRRQAGCLEVGPKQPGHPAAASSATSCAGGDALDEPCAARPEGWRPFEVGAKAIPSIAVSVPSSAANDY